MVRYLFTFSVIIYTYSFSQTHFTIPQNVWRISIEQDISIGKWKGHDGKNGWSEYSYEYNGSNYNIHQYWKQNINKWSIQIEYGLSDRTTFTLQIPQIQRMEQSHSWVITSDSLSTALNSIMSFYFPKEKSNSGLGNVNMGLNMLINGNPAWRGGKRKFSIYGGIDVTFPFGERMGRYYPNDVDEIGVPDQFKQLPMGNGLTRWRGKIFGELYRKAWGRLININWSISGAAYTREVINPSYSFLWSAATHIDSIATVIGKDVLHKQGSEFAGLIQGQLEVVPQRLFFSTGVYWLFSGRDKLTSNSDEWDQWMAVRKNYDTKRTAISQYMKINILNVDSFKQIGPMPFELEIGLRWFIPYLTYYTYGYTTSWIRISSYFQAW